MTGQLLVTTVTALCLLSVSNVNGRRVDKGYEEKGKCPDAVDVTKQDCTNLQFYSTLLPSRHLGCTSMGCLDKIFVEMSAKCGSDFEALHFNHFLCAFVYPRCVDNRVMLPCRKYCRDSLFRCKEFEHMKAICEDLPEETNVTDACVKKGRRGPKVSPVYCSEHTHKVCGEMGFGECLVLKNGSALSTGRIGQRIQDEDNTFLDILSVTESCTDPLVKFYLCGYHLPISTEIDQAIYPCPEYCHEVIKRCPVLRRYIGEDMCSSVSRGLLPHSGSLYCVDPPFSTTVTLKRKAVTSVQRGPFLPRGKRLNGYCSDPNSHYCGQCEPHWQTECLSLGYTKTIFNNAWSPDEETSRKKFLLAIPAIASGCSPNILLYVCTQLFPVCASHGKTRTACRSVCEDVNRHCCSYLNKQDCSALPETNCLTSSLQHEVCGSAQTQCVHTKKCIPKSSVCDMINNCGDWSDERDCTCDPTNQWSCKSGMCIPSEDRCNGVFDCPDESDEDDQCACQAGDFTCRRDNDKCVMKQWRCDGQNDCPSGDDELLCDCFESETHWRCVNNQCIQHYQRCDGKRNCLDKSDEIDCISLQQDTNILSLKTSTGDYMNVCFEGFTSPRGHQACLILGHVSASDVKPGNESFTKLKFQMTGKETATALGPGTIVDDCPRGEVVALDCNQRSCGHSKKPVPGADFETAVAGQWPWVVYISVTRDRSLICGGGILNEYFILTSANCVQRIKNINEIEIGAGSHIFNLVDTRPNQRRYKVESTIIHPKFDPAVNNSEHDIALILLKERIEFNDDTKPLCLPSETDYFSKATDCFLAGWGQFLCDKDKTRLRQRKLTLRERRLDVDLRPTERYAEFYKGYEEFGPGDSGSPIFCNDISGTFKFVGIAPTIHSESIKKTQPLAGECRVTRSFTFPAVQEYLDWITSQTECVFECDNGRCLVHRHWVCNNVDDCGDNSDESKHCGGVNFNCSFDKPFLCGYKMFGDNWKHLTSGLDLNNQYPLFDHTVGKYPGHWVSISPYSYMKSPLINVTGPRCVRFHYFFRGTHALGTAVFYYNGTYMKQVADYKKRKGTSWKSRWYMETFDVQPGPVQIIVRTYEGVFSIDDIWLLEGTCKPNSCLENEYPCHTERVPNCLPLSTRCNVVADCDDVNLDESCKGREYKCDFENGKTCGLLQSGDEDLFSDLKIVNSSVTKSNISDHTFRSASGAMLSLNPNNWSSSKVFMTQSLYLNYTTYCMRLYYASTTNLTLVIFSIISDLKFLNYRVQVKADCWRGVQLRLGNIYRKRATLFYSIEGVQEDFGAGGELLLDDISISRGACACKKGWLLCRNQDKCVPISKVCDRRVDCRARTDEMNCSCTSGELRCKSGMCVRKEKICDGIKDCPDGLDEGQVCDKKKSVSCDFESVFMCGYTMSPEPGLGLSGWTRMNTRFNGSYGHITEYKSAGTGFTNNFYMGSKFYSGKSVASLISIPFNSAHQGVRFSYFMYDPLGGNLDPYEFQEAFFQLWYEYTNSTGHTIQDMRWGTYATLDYSWRTQCINIPAVSDVRIIFKIEFIHFGMRMVGLDDVTLLNSPC